MARPTQSRAKRTSTPRVADASIAEAVGHDYPPTDADEIGDAVPTSQALAIVEYLSPALPGLTLDDIDAVERYVGKASADATKRAYTSDWRIFVAWCDERAMPSLPSAPAAVAAFLAQEADRGVARSTIGRRLAAIVFAHRAAGLIPPSEQVGAAVLDRALRGIRRDKRTQRPTKKHAADGDILRDMLRGIVGEDIRSSRDRALLAIGMGGAFRRSELVALQLADVKQVPAGLEILVPFSKGDQLGQGELVVIPDRPRIAAVALLRAWIDTAAITEGPLFRKLTPQGRLTAKPMSDRGVALIVKARAAAAGYDPSLFSGHSLRAGFLTEAGRQGANPFRMKEHSRHKSLEMVGEYVRNHELFRDHAGDKFL
jgi:integrase